MSRVGGRAALVASSLAAAVLLSSPPSGTLAGYADTGTVTTGALGTGVPAPATFTCGGLGVLSVTFNWAAVPGVSSYTLHYGNNGTQTVSVPAGQTSATVVSAISGGTAWVQANRTFASGTWTSARSPQRTYTVAVVSLCS